MIGQEYTPTVEDVPILPVADRIGFRRCKGLGRLLMGIAMVVVAKIIMALIKERLVRPIMLTMIDSMHNENSMEWNATLDRIYQLRLDILHF